MLKVNVKYVNLYMRCMNRALENNEIKKAARYWLLAFHELNRQKHIAKAHKIHDKMTRLMFQIEIDESFETYQEANN